MARVLELSERELAGRLAAYAASALLDGIQACMQILDATEEFGAEIMARAVMRRVGKGNVLYHFEELDRISQGKRTSALRIRMRGSDGSRVSINLLFTGCRLAQDPEYQPVESDSPQGTLSPSPQCPD